MSARGATSADARRSLERITRGLSGLGSSLPHLVGLAAAVRVVMDDRVPTMGVFASGRLVANPEFTARLTEPELEFVLAHEVLHLALRTHDRAVGSAHLEFNYAHDYIINDILREALGRPIPAGGLDMHGARERTAEDIVLEMRRNQKNQSRSKVWEGETVSIEIALAGGGGAGAGDVLDAEMERSLFPTDKAEQAKRIRAIKDLAVKGMADGRLLLAMRGRGNRPGSSEETVSALRGVYHLPWQIAVQRWLEGIAPAERTFARASRRGAERTDVVLPGRRRETQMLNIALDTSGSMTAALPSALGAIADFCEITSIDEIRVVQCDTAVTADEIVSPGELAQYRLKGFGGSDLTPAFETLAADPRVKAVIAITDGDITYPQSPMPFAVLWVVPGVSTSFAPPYGRVVTMQGGSAP